MLFARLQTPFQTYLDLRSTSMGLSHLILINNRIILIISRHFNQKPLDLSRKLPSMNPITPCTKASRLQDILQENITNACTRRSLTVQIH